MRDDDTKHTGTLLIALDATAEQTSACTPPGDMIDPRHGHMLLTSGGKLVACGGFSQPSKIDRCEEYDRELHDWIPLTNTLKEGKANFPSVQLDENKIWMGRKLPMYKNKLHYQ